jgi:biopolymer transport protein ExbB/TolQ
MNDAVANTTRYPLSLRPLAAAIMVGIPLAGLALVVTQFSPFGRELFDRYLAHPLEHVELALFCCGLGVFVVKLWSLRAEWAALERSDWLPANNGIAATPTDAGAWARRVASGDHTDTWLARRYVNALDHVERRRGAAGLDEQLRTLADADAMVLEGSAALTRFITWAIPILGFLGTVLGITGAISGVTPEKLEASLSTVTDGLALAFDATAVALALTMVLMFTASMVERAETRVLEEVDARLERDLPPRFETIKSSGGESAAVASQIARVVAEAMGRQATELANSLAHAVAHAVRGAVSEMTGRIEALDRAAAIRAEETRQGMDRSSANLHQILQTQQVALTQWGEQVSRQMVAPVQALDRVHEGLGEVGRLQALLAQNLTALSQGNALEEVLHQLAGATHLLAGKASRLRDPAVVESGHGLSGPRVHAAARVHD